MRLILEEQAKKYIRWLVTGVLVILALAITVGLLTNRMVHNQPMGWFLVAVLAMVGYTIATWARRERSDVELVKRIMKKHGIQAKE
jgi:uncharacterized membrane protein YeaQ/YmgE (transglycosylase-associated protein family)